MLSDTFVATLDAKKYDLITIQGSPARWDSDKRKFVDVRLVVGTHDFGIDELVDVDVKLYKKIETTFTFCCDNLRKAVSDKVVHKDGDHFIYDHNPKTQIIKCPFCSAKIG